jgi:hypothetical protein
MSDSLLQTLLALPLSVRQKRLTRGRKALTAAEFVQQITDQGGDRDAAVLIWRHLADWGYVAGFTPYPTDNLPSVFGIDEEELDEDLILSILTELKLPVPSQEFLAQFGSVDTPLRVAELAAQCRKSKP